MKHKIFLPSDSEMRKLMENAWQEFCEQANTAGMDEEAVALMKDIFIRGYCSGHNDTLGIIRDQMAIYRLISESLN